MSNKESFSFICLPHHNFRRKLYCLETLKRPGSNMLLSTTVQTFIKNRRRFTEETQYPPSFYLSAIICFSVLYTTTSAVKGLACSPRVRQPRSVKPKTIKLALASQYQGARGKTIKFVFVASPHAALRRKSKDWLARNRDNVSELRRHV